MALKDWKKIGKNDWQKTINNNWNILWYGKFAAGYAVVMSNSKERRIVKSGFKTKSQALKFAKQYMRIH